MLSNNAFVNKSEQPADEDITAALGAAKALWNQLLKELGTEYALTTTEWHSYSRKAGWALRVKHGDRNIVYLSPENGTFTAAFALGGKAIEAARDSGLPQRALKAIDEAKKYAEGTAVRIQVTAAADLKIVKKLVGAKLQN
jgi:Protein of unknown function (DUF3788)